MALVGKVGGKRLGGVVEEREGAEDGACVVVYLGFDDEQEEDQNDKQGRKALPMYVGGGVQWWWHGWKKEEGRACTAARGWTGDVGTKDRRWARTTCLLIAFRRMVWSKKPW